MIHLSCQVFSYSAFRYFLMILQVKPRRHLALSQRRPRVPGPPLRIAWCVQETAAPADPAADDAAAEGTTRWEWVVLVIF